MDYKLQAYKSALLHISSCNNNFVINVNSATSSCRVASVLSRILLLCRNNLRLWWPNCLATLMRPFFEHWSLNGSCSADCRVIDDRNELLEGLTAAEASDHKRACDYVDSVVSRQNAVIIISWSVCYRRPAVIPKQGNEAVDRPRRPDDRAGVHRTRYYPALCRNSRKITCFL